MMGGITLLPSGQHAPLVTIAVTGVMNMSFVVPLEGVENLADGFPGMLRELAEQAKRANMGLVVGADASKLLKDFERNGK